MAKLTAEQAFEVAIREHHAGRREQAEAIYRKIMDASPHHPDALHMLGALVHERGRPGEAIELIRRAIDLRPQHAGYRHTLGVVLAAAGDMDGAISSYQAALGLRPGDASILHELARVLQRHGKLQEAIGNYNRAIAANPDSPELLNDRGAAHQALGDIDQAIADFRASLRLRPSFAAAHNNLGNALLESGRMDEAIDSLAQAIAHDDKLADAQYNMGNALREKDDLDRAIEAYRRALSLRPGWSDALNNLGTALKESGQLDEAIECYRQGAVEGGSKIFGNLLYAIHFHPDYDAARIRREHAAWNEIYARPLAPAGIVHGNDPSPDRKLRIGYVSPDFRHHSQSFFILPLLSHHDHANFEIYCYSDVARPDDLTNRVRQCADVWHETARLSDAEVAKLVGKDGIDILVDLTLHMSRNRMLTFARKPAPVQVTWLGYPSTTGLMTMDYRLSDPYLDPPGAGDELYSEGTIRLPQTFWCYDPLESGPDSRPLPAKENGYITFGSLNAFYKVTAPTIDAWARVMSSVSDSRLILLAPRRSARRRFVEAMQNRGISPDRIEFRDRMQRSEYLATFRQIDICLDPIPCPGHTTTFDSLWMGVPVVTMAGATAISRGGASILTNLELQELVAKSADQYVDVTRELVGNIAKLSDLRSTLRDRMRGSRLMDANRFAGNIQEVYRVIWRRWCKSQNTITPG
jgi:predicted O-linked N-acetylglucosamine transferase (SPINDLY family)